MVRSSGETCGSTVSPMSDDQGSDSNTATTWHHGLIARWWANFNLDGPEIEFFRPYVASGQPTSDHRPARPAGSGLTASSTRCATGSPASSPPSVA